MTGKVETDCCMRPFCDELVAVTLPVHGDAVDATRSKPADDISADSENTSPRMTRSTAGLNSDTQQLQLVSGELRR